LKRIWLFSISAALCLVPISPAKTKCQPQFLNEHLTARINCLNIPVATATLVVTQDTAATGEPIYHLAVSAKSTPFYSILYRVDNRYDSYFTWPDARTVRYQRRIDEPGVDLNREVRYQDGKALYEEEEPLTVPCKVQDLFLSLYALRGQPLEEGQVIDSSIELDGQLWTIRSRALGRERIKTRYGSFGAVKVEVRYLRADQSEENRRASDILTNNLVKEKTKVTIWFSDDEQKIPLKAHCHVSPFSIKAVFSVDQ